MNRSIKVPNYLLYLKFMRAKSAQASSKPATADEVNINVSRDETNQSVKTSKYNEDINITTQSNKKLPKRKPLVKNFFVGIADKELLAHPEVIPRDDMQQLQNEQVPLKNFFSDINDAKTIDATRTIPKDIINNLKELGCFGFNAPKKFGGKDLQMSASLMASEPETLSPNIAVSLLSHRVVIDILNKAATEEQRQRYMAKLSSGASIATEAIFEFDNPDVDLFNTKAEFIPELDTWILNGEKAFVINGSSAGLFLVLAETYKGVMDSENDSGLTIFLVDSSNQGVKVGHRHIMLGCRGVDFTKVKFENVKVSNDCIIGKIHDGSKIGEEILTTSRLRSALIGLALAKDSVNGLAKHCVENNNSGIPLIDTEIMKNHASQAVCATYAMESMIYFTAGIFDEFDEHDISLESAITKYFTFTRLFDVATKSLSFIGPKALQSGEPTEIILRNAAQLLAMGETIDTLRIYIALTGLQHAGVELIGTVRKNRNPLFHPLHIFKKFLEPANMDNPKTKMGLGEHLHPSLEGPAQCLERNIARLKICTELLLSRHGIEVMTKHMEATRLAEIATITYSMFASLSRASRSYCIGLPLADHEMLLATAICCQGNESVKTISNELLLGKYINNDGNLQRLSKQVFKSRGYYAVHPLTYNF